MAAPTCIKQATVPLREFSWTSRYLLVFASLDIHDLFGSRPLSSTLSREAARAARECQCKCAQLAATGAKLRAPALLHHNSHVSCRVEAVSNRWSPPIASSKCTLVELLPVLT